jgi:hypothetical protein
MSRFWVVKPAWEGRGEVQWPSDPRKVEAMIRDQEERPASQSSSVMNRDLQIVKGIRAQLHMADNGKDVRLFKPEDVPSYDIDTAEKDVVDLRRMRRQIRCLFGTEGFTQGGAPQGAQDGFEYTSIFDQDVNRGMTNVGSPDQMHPSSPNSTTYAGGVLWNVKVVAWICSARSWAGGVTGGGVQVFSGIMERYHL